FLTAVSAATAIFFITQINVIPDRISLFTPLTPAQFAFGLTITILTLEATRRAIGLGLSMIAGLFIVYNLYGHFLGGVFGHGFISYHHFVDVTAYTTTGLFSVPVQVAATYAFLFVMFGTFLEK